MKYWCNHYLWLNWCFEHTTCMLSILLIFCVKFSLQVIFSNLAFVQLACSYNLVSWAHFWMTTSSIVHTKRQSCLENLHKPNIYYPKWTQIMAIILCILLAIVTTNSNNKTEMQFLQYHWQCCSAYAQGSRFCNFV